MKLIRIWFAKEGPSRYISHLDLNRCFSRAMKRANIPLWYTEGFNPHPFITFALPLSLGVRGERECMDIKLTDNISGTDIAARLNCVLPEGIRILSVRDAVMKPGMIAYAQYRVLLSCENLTKETLFNQVNIFLAQEDIPTVKRAKSGEKSINLKHYIDSYKTALDENGVILDLLLPSGSRESVNPNLVIAEIEKRVNTIINADISRTGIYTEQLKEFH